MGLTAGIQLYVHICSDHLFFPSVETLATFKDQKGWVLCWLPVFLNFTVLTGKRIRRVKEYNYLYRKF